MFNTYCFSTAKNGYANAPQIYVYTYIACLVMHKMFVHRFLWGWAKEEVYWAKPRTMEQLEDRIRNVITNVPHDFLQKAVDSIPGRMRKLVKAAGACIEF